MTALPEFQRGWRILAGSLIGIALGVSSLYFYSFGLFIKPLAAEFGWSRGEASLGALVGTAVAALVSMPMGRLIDRFGSRRIALISMALLGFGLLAHASAVRGIVSFLLVTAVTSFLSVGSTALPYSRLTVLAFERGRGLALGIILAGSGIGAMVVPMALTPLIATGGWQAGYCVLGFAALAGILPVWLLLRDAEDPRLARPRVGVPVAALLRSPTFVRLGLAFALVSMAVIGTVVQFIPMLLDRGVPPARTGGIASLIGLSAIGGRLLIGSLLDRLPAERVAASLFLIAGTGIAILAAAPVAFAIPGAIVLGLAVGAEIDLLSYLTARCFPRPLFAEVNGALYALFLLGAAIGPFLSGSIFDLTGGYSTSLLIAALCLVAAALLLYRPLAFNGLGEVNN